MICFLALSLDLFYITSKVIITLNSQLYQLSTILVLIVSEDAEQIEEEVDEVEIERERTEKRKLLHAFARIRSHTAHLLNLLRVVSGQTYEDQHAYVADDEVKTRASYEDVHHRSDDNADERHEQQLADGGQVCLRGVAHERHRTERARRNKERLGYYRGGVSEEHH